MIIVADMVGARLDSRDFVPMRPEEIEGSLTERFARRVQAHRDRLAVKYDEQALTYEELDRRSSRIANALLGHCGDRPEPIALWIEQGVTLVASILGVLKAGKFYVPLEPSHPASRLTSAVVECEPAAVLTDDRNLAAARALGGGTRVVLDVAALLDGGSTQDPALPLSPDALAYVFFTSGSTRRPKGVMDCHRNVLHNVMRYTNSLRITPEDRLSLVQSASFSGTVSSLFGALLNGAAVLPYDLRRDGLGPALASWVQRERITIYHSVPSIFRSLVEGGGSFPDVRVVRLEGDVARLTDVELHRKHFPSSVLAVGLGATETGLSCQLLLGRDSKPIDGILPIGFPTSDIHLSVHDPEARPLPPDCVGELAVTSPYLAVGYWKRPEMTAAAFTPAADGGAGRTYRTGDLARIRRDGRVEFLGRKESRLKIAGQTVEAADVETSLLRTGFVREAAAKTHEDATGESRLFAYVVPTAREAWSEREVRALLARSVPAHMVPHAFVLLSKLPLTETGKLDRHALGPPPPARRRTTRAGRDHLEKRLADVWTKTLGLPSVGIDEDFRELGGDSLLAARVSAMIDRRMGRKVPASAILRLGTVEALALAIRQGLGLPPTSAIVPLHAGGSKMPLFFVTVPFSGHQRLALLSAQLGPDRPLYAVEPLDGADFAQDDIRIESLAARRIRDVSAIQPRGPYLLGGECYGAVVAFEMARQLRAAGEEVSVLALCQITPFDFPSLLSAGSCLRYRAHQALGRHLGHVGARVSHHLRRSLQHSSGPLIYIRHVADRARERAAAWRTHASSGPTAERLEERAFRAYRPRRYTGDVLLVLSEAETRAYTRDPEAAWRGLAAGRVAVDLVKGRPFLLDEPEVLDVGAILQRELSRADRAASTGARAPG